MSAKRRANTGPRVRDRALLVRRTPFGNSSLVVHAITRRHGRVALMAKGAYRPKSRYSGVLDWFDTLELEWTEPRRPERHGPERVAMGTLVLGDVATRRRRLTRSIDRYVAAQTMVELLDHTTRTGYADDETLLLAEAAFDALDASEDPAVARGTLAWFELHLARVLGIAPALVRCAACGQAAETIPAGEGPRAHFSAQSGGRLCHRHAEEARAAGRRVGTLPLDVLERAHAMIATATVPNDSVHDPDGRVLDFAARFLDHHLDVRTRSHGRLLAQK